jgi:acyl-[acyl-carrier-protein] desaturase
MKLGQKAGEPILLKLMSLISRDENFHYIFYRSLMKLVLETDSDLALPAIMKQLYSFEMPGAGGMENFDERTQIAADLSIYGALEHRDMVIKPLLQYWGIDKLKPLSPEGRRAQERILKLLAVLDRMVERQQAQSSLPSTVALASP